MARIVIVGGGPGGYEAALVAVQLGAEVTLVDSDGLGGAAVLTDCVPSKTLIATAEAISLAALSRGLGVLLGNSDTVGVDLAQVNGRVLALARAQSHDIGDKLATAGVKVVKGTGYLAGPNRVVVEHSVVEHSVVEHGVERTSVERTSVERRPRAETLYADAVLLATGAHPRTLPGVEVDGERVLDWRHLYDLPELPESLIVVGSGVTGAEFAGAYLTFGSEVTLVSSRDRVLPGEDPDAAQVLEDVFRRRGMHVMGRSRAQSVKRSGDGVVVTLTDGRTVEGSHCLLAVGSVPNTAGIGLEATGVRLSQGGHVVVDRVSRTSVGGVYAAGDCTGVLMLASVAAMQGRIAMYHALGDAVTPLDLHTVSSNIFTEPEIATVGYGAADVATGRIEASSVMLPLGTNPRAKMFGIRDGFVKLFCRPGTGIIVGGVVVAPRASELIHPISLACDLNLTVDQIAGAFTVYPSLTGSIAEAARQLHTRRVGDGTS